MAFDSSFWDEVRRPEHARRKFFSNWMFLCSVVALVGQYFLIEATTNTWNVARVLLSFVAYYGLQQLLLGISAIFFRRRLVGLKTAA